MCKVIECRDDGSEVDHTRFTWPWELFRSSELYKNLTVRGWLCTTSSYRSSRRCYGCASRNCWGCRSWFWTLTIVSQHFFDPSIVVWQPSIHTGGIGVSTASSIRHDTHLFPVLTCPLKYASTGIPYVSYKHFSLWHSSQIDIPWQLSRTENTSSQLVVICIHISRSLNWPVPPS